jgi:cell division protein FtsQ
MKKLKILLVWLVITGYLVFSLGFVTDKYADQVCESIKVNIADSLTSGFVTTGDVMGILLGGGEKILGYQHRAINTLELEKLLSNEPFIKKAELYKTADGVLHADILQRKPIIRIISQSGKSYYLDNDGMILPVSPKFTSRVLVANGYIPESFIKEASGSASEVTVPAGKRNSVIYDLYSLAFHISNSDLWNAQITQIYVDSNYEYELIPRVGAHVIRLGDASDYETKFRKLEALYRYGLNNKGWNHYKTIDLKYKNQVVCTKR